MNGIDWLKTLPPTASVQRETEILEALASEDLRSAFYWYAVPISSPGHKGLIAVGSDAIAVGRYFDDQIRVNLTAEGAQRLCDLLGMQMPTAKMLDAAMDVSIPMDPCLFTPDKQGKIAVTDPITGSKVVTPMSSKTAMGAHSRRVDAVRAGRDNLGANCGKAWILDSAIQAQYAASGVWSGCNYGWYSPLAPNWNPPKTRRLWQPVSTKHNLQHVDYSQVYLPFGRNMLVDGVLMAVRDVLADPELCKLLTYGGPIEDRHPGVDVQALFNELSPDPREIPLAELPMRIIQAAHFTPRSQREVDLIVLHVMQVSESKGVAASVAKAMSLPSGRQASVHYCVDADEIVQCLPEHDIAWGSQGANDQGIHIEHAGYSEQTAAQWHDQYSQRMLARSAKLCAGILKRWGLPCEFQDAESLLAGDAQGLTTHLEVTKACQLAKTRGLKTSPFFAAKSNHTDPGRSFPIAEFLTDIRMHM